MLRLTVNLIPLALVCIVSPIPISACIAMLSSRRPLANAVVYFLGTSTVLALAGLVVLLFLLGTAPPARLQLELGSGLKLALGVVLLVLAARAYARAPASATQPRWMQRIETINPVGAYLFGVVLVTTQLKILVVYMAGVNDIFMAEIGLVQQLLTMVWYLILVELGILTPIVIYALRPHQAAALLARGSELMSSAYRWIIVGLLSVLGIWLLVAGAVGLLG